MLWYDFVMLGILIYAGWQGAARGLVMQLTWIVAIVLAFRFSDRLSPQIEPLISIESEKLRHWIAMFVLYLGFSLATFLVARFLNNAIEKARFEAFDRQLGALFGLFKGVLAALVVTFFAITLSDSLRATVLKSKTGYVACVILDNIRPFIPDDAHPLIRDSLRRYSQELESIHDRPGQEGSFHDVFADDFGSSDSPEDSLSWPAERPLDPDGASDGRWPDDRLRPSQDSDGYGRSRSPSYRDFLSVLPAGWQRTVGNSLKDRWNRLSPSEREDWIDELRILPEEAVGDLLRKWSNPIGRRESRAENSGDTEPAGRLLELIAEFYPDPDSIIFRTRTHLQGVPPAVQAAVLEDWYADVTMARNDPDPRTDITTRLDDRILSQMDRLRVAFDDLGDDDLRRRLRRSLR